MNKFMESIKLKKEYLPLNENFKLENLKKMNIIVGKNNVGKTRFFEAVERDYGKEIDIIFIRANDVNPADDHFKGTAATSSLIKRVSKLFNNLNIEPELKNIKEIKGSLESLVEKINNNFQDFTNNKELEISNKIGSNLKIETVIQSLINKFEISEVGVNDLLDLKNIGQGYQRILIASILKSYIDLVKDIGIKDPKKDDRQILLLFEEPEVFLHPQLKRTLNSVLKKISDIPNYTVIISTHDPYFLWSNKNDDDIKIYSFVKENGLTLVKTDNISFEIEDEMLHISLFNDLIKKMKQKGDSIGLGNTTNDTMVDTSKNMEKYIPKGFSSIKKDYIWNDNTYNVVLPIYIRNVLHHRTTDDYSGKELEDSVKILNVILSNIS